MRSFTIDSVYNKTRKLRVCGGRYVSDTPSAAASKVFAQVSGLTGKAKLKINVRETTQGSNKNIYSYEVKRIKQNVKVERDGVPITYKFKTKVKSLQN